MNKKKMHEKDTKNHTIYVPVAYTVIWIIALAVGLLGNSILVSFGIMSLISTIRGAVCWAFWTVYITFIFEFIICIFDLTIQHRFERFRSGVFYILMMFAAITAAVLISWFCYDKITYINPTLNIFLFSMIFFASLQKFQSSWIQNNIEKYIVSERTIQRRTESA